MCMHMLTLCICEWGCTYSSAHVEVGITLVLVFCLVWGRVSFWLLIAAYTRLADLWPACGDHLASASYFTEGTKGYRCTTTPHPYSGPEGCDSAPHRRMANSLASSPLPGSTLCCSHWKCWFDSGKFQAISNYYYLTLLFSVFWRNRISYSPALPRLCRQSWPWTPDRLPLPPKSWNYVHDHHIWIVSSNYQWAGRIVPRIISYAFLND